VAGGDRDEAVCGEDDGMADWWARLPMGATASEGEGRGLTSGDGALEVRGRERERERGVGRRWPRGRVSRAREGEAAAAWAGNGPAEGRRVSLFFIFQILFLFLHHFF
jgi:hypothetical protein